jgi:hypothetical protein
MVYLYPQELSDRDRAKTSYTPPTGWQVYAASNYRLGLSSWPHTFWQDIEPHFRDPVTVRIQLLEGPIIEHDFQSASQVESRFRYPFSGKGSPEDVQLAAQLLYRFRPVTTPIEQFFSMDFVGLDCNGFVGGYYRRVVLGTPWLATNPNVDPGPTTEMDDMLTWGKELHDLSELQEDGTYIMSYCDDSGVIYLPDNSDATKFGHVQITEPNTLYSNPGNQAILVVEASPFGGRKLRAVEYTILSEKKTRLGGKPISIFHIRSGPERFEMKVRISRLKVK